MSTRPARSLSYWLFRNIAEGRDRMRARILLFFQVTFATVIVGLVLPMSMEFPSPQREQMFVLTGANLAFVIGLFLLMRSGRIMLVCWLQVLAMWVTPLIHMLVEGGLYSTAFIGWLMDIVLAGLLIGRVGGTILAGLSVAASLVLTIMWQHGLIAPPVVQPPLKMFALSAVMLLVLAALQWFGSKQSEQLEKRSKGLQARLDLLAEDYIGEWKWQLETGIIEWSKNMPAIVGRPNQRLEGNLRQLQAMVFPDDWKPFEQALKNAQKSPSKSYYVEHRVVDANGGIYWVENRGRVFFNENNVAVTVGGIITRIDERKYIESALDRRGKRLRLVFENSPVFILVLDVDGLILSINHVEEGYSREQIIGKARMLDYLPSQSHALAKDAMHRALASKEPVVYDLQGYGANGKIEWYANRLVQFREDGKVRLLLMASNITARKEAEERLERLATRDSLTGLANRHRILEMVDRLTSGDNRFFLLFIDLDHFKTINDTLGHTVGDQLLVHIAQEIQQMLGAQDHLARLGGDEFLALLVAEDFETDPAFRLRAEHTAARIITETALPHTIGTSELFVSASIGLSHFPRDAGTTGELIKFADLAMYEAKQRGRAGYAFFEKQLSQNIDERMRIDRLLRSAIERNELSLHFQPLVDTIDGKIRAAEVLLRWHPTGQEPVSPAVFIPIAEDTGLIRAIGDWVLREACQKAARWKKEFGKSPRLSINISARQMERESFASDVEKILHQAGLTASDIELELTETSLLSTISTTLPQLMQLAESGVHLVIDDFGTGYSSLSYLKKLPVRALKIDRSFVADIEKDKNDEAIIRAVMAMATGLGLKVVAEGVERQVQLDFLTEIGCHSIQGYFYGKPVPAEEFWKTWQGQLA